MASQFSSLVRNIVKKGITENPVMVFSKSYCPYCLRVKDLFEDMDVKYNALELDEHDHGEEIQQLLKHVTKQSTVPNVFVKGYHVGGSDATEEAKFTGKLQELLNKDVWGKVDL
ncbi:thioredoxin reductase [Actinomortierella ambigua]|uniref:Thioredoxin reductase n=1 Tax=Actinomortierella ambigua TaxID=1343610 RepID=A0A9P6QP83_9FUNG|nr:thioredoxin reductase [Actinomortierella ambigua]KAG0270621.1 thioredoxin reductase [Actinomortierella ambigua]